MSLTACNVKNKSGSIRIKRAYEPPSQSDGIRVLVDRLWPRGRSKADLSIHFWLKDVAPSAALRKWFDHDPKKWGEFRTRYEAELGTKRDAIDSLIKHWRKVGVTLVFSAHDSEHNNAVVLADFLRKVARKKKSRVRK